MHGTTLTKASNNWYTRPDDQRFTSLTDMHAYKLHQRGLSHQLTLGNEDFETAPIEGDPRGLVLSMPSDKLALPSHYAFGQLCARAESPAGFLRTLPGDLTADIINHRMASRPTDQVKALLRENEDGGSIQTLAALTGPDYGRIWDCDVIAALMDRFGDGVTGQFTVPGEFGVALDEVTKRNTTLFASDRDCFIFLADETNRIEVPNRRNGQPGSLARGFFAWNSEVGSASLGLATFLFDYTCSNRTVWGAEGYQEIRIRHSSRAPGRLIGEVAPAMIAYANSSADGIRTAIANAQAAKIGDEKEVVSFLTRRRFSATQAKAINLAHVNEEGRPIETLWDASVAVTAYAKGVTYQNERVDLEREGGKILALAGR